MKSSISREQVLQSPALIFLFWLISFGLMVLPHLSSHHRFSPLILIIGLPITLVTTAQSVYAMRGFVKWPRLPRESRKALRQALKTGILPNDPAALKALPNTVKNQLKLSRKNKQNKITLLVISVLLAINGLGNISNHKYGSALFTLTTAIFLTLINRKSQSIVANLERLDEQLERLPVQPVTDTTETEVKQSKIRTAAEWVLHISAEWFGALLLMTGMVTYWTNLDIALRLGLPLTILGLLFIAPYFVMKGRWIKTYVVLLLVACVTVVYRLHSSLGIHHITPASMQLSTDRQNPLEVVVYAAFHSSLVVVFFGALVLLDISLKQIRLSQERRLALASILTVIAVGALPFGVYMGTRTIQAQDGSQTTSEATDADSDATAATYPSGSDEATGTAPVYETTPVPVDAGPPADKQGQELQNALTNDGVGHSAPVDPSITLSN